MIALFLPLAIAAAAAPPAPVISPAVKALLDRRDTIGVPAVIQQLDAMADAGDASAVELLGETYYFGALGITPDPARACNYFERTVAHRGDSAQNLATCFYQGRGRPPDLAKARALYQQAHNLGYLKSGCALGNMMIRGEGGPRDAAAGLALCRADAEAGDPDAETDYGGYLLTGDHIAKDAVAARRLLTDAAQQKQANAAFLLGQIYWIGDGTPQDRAVAARWWHVAYDNGRKDAALMLGREALSRMLVERDGQTVADRAAMTEARQWLTVVVVNSPAAADRSEAQKLIATLDEIAKP